MDRDEVFALIAAERRRAADMFARLDQAQLDVRSLCVSWTVREVAVHLIGPFTVSIPRFVVGSLVSGGFDRYSLKTVRRMAAERPFDEVVAVLRANAETRWTPPGTGPAAPLTDLAVHTRDAARPLGLDTTAAPAAWRAALDFLCTPAARRGFVTRGRLDGLRLVATDLGWSSGAGLEVAGPAEALALAVTGRAVALDDLAGAGVPTLRTRIS